MRVVLCHRQCRRHGGETGGVDRRPCSIFKPSRYIVSRLNKEVCCSPNIPPTRKQSRASGDIQWSRLFNPASTTTSFAFSSPLTGSGATGSSEPEPEPFAGLHMETVRCRRHKFVVARRVLSDPWVGYVCVRTSKSTQALQKISR